MKIYDVVFRRMKNAEGSIIHTVTESIQVDINLHVQLYFKGCPLLFPPWFRHGTNFKLTSVTQLNNFPAYIRLKSRIFLAPFLEELQQSRFVKRGFSASLIRYMRRYTSLQSSVL